MIDILLVDHETPLNIFHRPDWVSAKKSPLKKVDRSANFEIKSGGVLLVYAQVSTEITSLIGCFSNFFYILSFH